MVKENMFLSMEWLRSLVFTNFINTLGNFVNGKAHGKCKFIKKVQFDFTSETDEKESDNDRPMFIEKNILEIL